MRDISRALATSVSGSEEAGGDEALVGKTDGDGRLCVGPSVTALTW
jgi:hypothetical protein